MPTSIKFGTDGWRAIIAEEFTFDNVRICAQSVAEYMIATGTEKRGMVIGYDTRFASEYFASAAAEVTAANGIHTYLCRKASPTPVISYAVKDLDAAGGIIITASHNPGRYNGFKFKQQGGSSASTDVIAKLERIISRIQASGVVERIAIEHALDRGVVEEFDPDVRYFRQIEELVDLELIRSSGLKVIIDAMYGAGGGYFHSLLNGGNIRLTELHGERNPAFPGIRPEPIAPNLVQLSRRIRRNKADVGLATDGDADRIGIIDNKGVYLTTLQVFAMLSLYLLEVCGKRGPIVKTITSSSMIDRLGEAYNVPVYETPVGFKYVAPKMVEVDALMGGEESGGYAYRGHILERDGILSGLLFLEFMIKMRKSPSQLVEFLYDIVGPHYYHRIDVEFPASERQTIMDRVNDINPSQINNVDILRIETSDGYRYILSDGSWLLIRFSGTEPILRIYAESDSPDRVNDLLSEGRNFTGV